MAFEVYQRTVNRVETPTLTISSEKRMIFNAAAVRILLGSAVQRIVLLWDRNARRIGFMGASKSDKNSYSISFTGGRSGSVRAKGFLVHIGWSATSRTVLSLVWNPKEKMFEASIPSKCLARPDVKDRQQ